MASHPTFSAPRDRYGGQRRHLKALWADPVWRAKRIEQLRASQAARMADPAYRTKISKSSRRFMRRQWADPVEAARMRASLAAARAALKTETK